MKRTLLTLVCLAVALCGLYAATGNVAEVKAKGVTTQVTFFANDIVRVVKYPSDGAAPTRKSLVVTMAPQEDLKVKRSESSARVTLNSGILTVNVDKRTGAVQFLSKGKNLLKEKDWGFEKRTSGPDAGAYRTTIVYQLDKNEPIYGLGAIQDGRLNRRNTKYMNMEQKNLEDYQYVIQSLKGWGLYWDNYSRADYVDNAEGMKFSAEVGDAVDYYFMFGGSADGVNAKMRQLSGEVPMFPLWTYGYWQCRERYKSVKELMDVVNWHRKNGVPLDGIVQDWQYWGSNYTWNAMDFLAESYARGRQMVKDVHKQNAHLMISIWASFGPQTLQYKELESKGLLYDFETWPQSGLSSWPPNMDYPSGVRVYDALSPEARDIYWKYLRKLYDYGIDAWWMDSTDPDYFKPKDSEYDHSAGDGTWRRYRNAFPLASVSGVYDNQRKVSDEKRVFIMTRSAFAGQQRYGSGLWSGDVASSWDMLRKQIPLGLNYAMTGCPNFNTDIGGFFCSRYNTRGGGSAPKNTQFQELYVRWMQYALTCPVFRSHGADAPREIYQFGKRGEPVFDAIESAIRFRYQMLPYLYSTAWQVTSNGDTYQRALVYDFPKDQRVWDMTDEFMFGRSILALPVTKPQYTKEAVIKETDMSGWDKKEATASNAVADFTQTKSVEKYLPKGCAWYDLWTEKRYNGGQYLLLQTTFYLMPIFVRAGSIMPMAPVTMYAEQKKWDNLDITVYPGADATFTLYEDEGDNYNYEKGVYTTITLKWDDSARRLTIGKRNGQFPGMLQQRKFNVRVAGTKTVKTVDYSGAEISVPVAVK